MAMLIVTSTLNGQVVAQQVFDKELVLLGRDPGADVVLDNPGISRHHAEIWRCSDGTFVVRDLGSSNGTLLDSKPLHEEILPKNAVIQVGKYLLHTRTVLGPDRGVIPEDAGPWHRNQTIRAQDGCER